jgi:hypothetical protein
MMIAGWKRLLSGRCGCILSTGAAYENEIAAVIISHDEAIICRSLDLAL